MLLRVWVTLLLCLVSVSATGEEVVFHDNIASANLEDGKVTSVLLHKFETEHHKRLDAFIANGAASGEQVLAFVPPSTGMGNVVEGYASLALLAIASGRLFVEVEPAVPVSKQVTWFKQRNVAFGSNPLGSLQSWQPSSPFWFSDEKATEDSRTDAAYLGQFAYGSLKPFMPNDMNLVCGDLVFSDSSLVFAVSNLWWGSQILENTNPIVQSRLAAVFGDDYQTKNIYHIVVNWLLPPKADIQAVITQFVDEQFSRFDTVVGLHIRTGETFSDIKNRLSVFATCAKQQFPSAGDINIGYYISSDDYNTYNWALEALGENAFWYQENDYIAKDVPEALQMKEYFARHKDWRVGLIDNLLLSKADKLVVTCGSSYSRLAFGGFADTAPAYVTFESQLWSKEHVSGQCLQATSARPCADRNLLPLQQAKCLSQQVKDKYQKCEVG